MVSRVCVLSSVPLLRLSQSKSFSMSMALLLNVVVLVIVVVVVVVFLVIVTCVRELLSRPRRCDLLLLISS